MPENETLAFAKAKREGKDPIGDPGMEAVLQKRNARSIGKVIMSKDID